MSEEENKLKSADSGGTTYDKAKDYWQTVEPTVCGMLGGIPEVGFIGENLNLMFKVCFHGNCLF